MNKTILARAEDKAALHTAHVSPSPDPVLVTENIHRIHGTFASQSRTTAGTSILATPELNQEIILTDLIVSTEKLNAGVIVVQWTDDVETIVIYQGFTNDGPINFAIGFAGRFAGWKDARLEMVVTGNMNSTVTVGYYKLPEGLTFAEWDAIR